MKTIAFDIMGNDNGVQAGVKSALAFVSQNKDYKVILVGNADQISEFAQPSERLEIIDIKAEVDGEKGARAARGEANSMSVAINLVKDGKADAVLSSGNSAAYITLTTLTLRRIEGIKRPAFMPIFPTIEKGKKFVLLDAGANLQVDAEIIQQWAVLGSTFVSTVLKTPNPRVSILNIGTEDSKGFDWAIEANKNLKENKDLNYTGFVESRDLLKHITDVAVIDGYGGNLVLKSMEGAALNLLSLLKKNIMSKTIYKIGAMLSKGAFVNTKETLDYRNSAAAFVLGLNGLAVKTHGGADIKAYNSCFETIKDAIDNDVINKFKKAVTKDE